MMIDDSKNGWVCYAAELFWTRQISFLFQFTWRIRDLFRKIMKHSNMFRPWPFGKGHLRKLIPGIRWVHDVKTDPNWTHLSCYEGRYVYIVLYIDHYISSSSYIVLHIFARFNVTGN
jgi:hypothetical protein